MRDAHEFGGSLQTLLGTNNLTKKSHSNSLSASSSFTLPSEHLVVPLRTPNIYGGQIIALAQDAAAQHAREVLQHQLVKNANISNSNIDIVVRIGKSRTDFISQNFNKGKIELKFEVLAAEGEATVMHLFENDISNHGIINLCVLARDGGDKIHGRVYVTLQFSLIDPSSISENSHDSLNNSVKSEYKYNSGDEAVEKFETTKNSELTFNRMLPQVLQDFLIEPARKLANSSGTTSKSVDEAIDQVLEDYYGKSNIVHFPTTPQRVHAYIRKTMTKQLIVEDSGEKSSTPDVPYFLEQFMKNPTPLGITTRHLVVAETIDFKKVSAEVIKSVVDRDRTRKLMLFKPEEKSFDFEIGNSGKNVSTTDLAQKIELLNQNLITWISDGGILLSVAQLIAEVEVGQPGLILFKDKGIEETPFSFWTSLDHTINFHNLHSLESIVFGISLNSSTTANPIEVGSGRARINSSSNSNNKVISFIPDYLALECRCHVGVRGRCLIHAYIWNVRTGKLVATVSQEALFRFDKKDMKNEKGKNSTAAKNSSSEDWKTAAEGLPPPGVHRSSKL